MNKSLKDGLIGENIQILKQGSITSNLDAAKTAKSNAVTLNNTTLPQQKGSEHVIKCGSVPGGGTLKETTKKSKSETEPKNKSRKRKRPNGGFRDLKKMVDTQMKDGEATLRDLCENDFPNRVQRYHSMVAEFEKDLIQSQGSSDFKPGGKKFIEWTRRLRHEGNESLEKLQDARIAVVLQMKPIVEGTRGMKPHLLLLRLLQCKLRQIRSLTLSFLTFRLLKADVSEVILKKPRTADDMKLAGECMDENHLFVMQTAIRALRDIFSAVTDTFEKNLNAIISEARPKESWLMY